MDANYLFAIKRGLVSNELMPTGLSGNLKPKPRGRTRTSMRSRYFCWTSGENGHLCIPPCGPTSVLRINCPASDRTEVEWVDVDEDDILVLTVTCLRLPPTLW